MWWLEIHTIFFKFLAKKKILTSKLIFSAFFSQCQIIMPLEIVFKRQKERFSIVRKYALFERSTVIEEQYTQQMLIF